MYQTISYCSQGVGNCTLWYTTTFNWNNISCSSGYVQAEGTARVPQSFRTAEGYRLGQWVGVQRSTKDRMSADRRQRLEAVMGWVWDATTSKHARKKP